MPSDLQGILQVHRAAFGEAEGEEIRALVAELLEDASAMPITSLVAVDEDQLVGHVLFTRVRIDGGAREVRASILAPLAVAPELQGTGVGGHLTREGLQRLADDGVELVFVLGHPSYYPRFGFEPAGVHGLEATRPIPEEHSAAWMVNELVVGVLDEAEGKVLCSDVLSRPEYW